jgi:D-arabinose 1-dehydrogenase-like Zn-dependent alcohol dehydrogenase
MASPQQLPSVHRGLQLESYDKGFELKMLPTPDAIHGCAIVKIEQAGVLSYHREIYNGERKYRFPKPIVGGYSAIGRIAAVGPDSTSLQLGQLIYVDCVMRGRDDPANLFLSAIHDGGTEGSQKLCRDVWRNGAFAEYMKVPLENCISLDEARLCRELGYTSQHLLYLSYLLVGFGGLRDIRVEPGERIVVSPATGGFGGAAVQVAVAMGAQVIAMGRNEKELARLKAHVLNGTPSASIETVRITGDARADAETLRGFGTLDAVLDFSPPAAKNSTHLESALSSLRTNGRASLMGILGEKFPMNTWDFISRNISLKAKLMYEREDMIQFVKMLEAGLLPKGDKLVDVKTFPMEEWKTALDVAAEHTGIGKLVSIAPQSQ